MFLSEYAPIDYLLSQDEAGVLSIIIDRNGPGYRSVGAMMAFSQKGKRIGSLSSGCIEDDLWVTAKNSLNTNLPIISHYGSDTEIFDLRLPCGGNMKIISLPNPNRKMLKKILSRVGERKKTGISINLLNGFIDVSEPIQPNYEKDIFKFNLIPEVKFIVMGAGVETHAFCSLSIAAGFKLQLLTPDVTFINDSTLSACDKLHLKSLSEPPALVIDEWTAIVLFFHDHDWEPPLLKCVLASNAFYIGAQGSKSAHWSLVNNLKEIGCSQVELSRLKSQIGLIPSARDPKTLAISVLADVIKIYNINQ